MLAVSFVTLDAFVRSYNSATLEDEKIGIKTRIGSYSSFKTMGAMPVLLIASLKKWPNEDTCFSAKNRRIIDWENIHNDKEVEICLIHTLTHIKNDDDINFFLERNGFGPVSIQNNILGIRISATCQENDFPCGAAVKNIGGFIIQAYAMTVSVSLIQSTPVDVTVTLSIL